MIRTTLFSLLILAGFPGTLSAQTSFRQADGKIEVAIDGRPFTAFHYSTTWDKPFLHPLRAPSGLVITRGFPLEEIEGETTDHRWQRGIFLGHDSINGVDFWRERSRDKTGRMVCRSTPTTRAGRPAGTLSAIYELVTPQDDVLGTVRQRFTFRRAGSNYLIDVETAIVADRGALKLGDTEEAMLGLRLADEFREDRGATLTNSDGLVGAKNIWGKRARWVDYSTTVKGEKVGVALFDHPTNPRHPTYWHARGYGLNAANIFGERRFTRDKTRDGSMTISVGGALSFRHRVVIHPGGLESVNIEELYGAFARER
ncbi:MAG: transmembrane prediction [Luteitalea sp.]|nr:transmembrane prediction [Luteitalea sp.]